MVLIYHGWSRMNTDFSGSKILHLLVLALEKSG